MNVLIPCAGAGSRFEKAGYTFPKPLIEVDGKPMIQAVVENLALTKHRHIFIVQKSHYDKYALQYLLPLIAPSCCIVQVEGVTEGAACTTLLAKKFIDNDEPLIISNCDQIINWCTNFITAPNKPLEDFLSNADGTIFTFKASHPKWSFVRTNPAGQILEVAEKIPISREANCGIFHWKKGSDYVKYAERMIEKEDRVKGEFYVAPVFNHAIEDGLVFYSHKVTGMWGIGTPEDLDIYIRMLQS